VFEEARNKDSDRLECEGHKWAHRVAEKLSPEQVDLLAPLPSESDRRESAAGKVVANIIAASRRRPRLKNTLLRACGVKEVIPEELIELPGKKYVPRGQLYSDEQEWLAKKCKAEKVAAEEQSIYEDALSKPFTDWQARELRTGRPRSHLTQMAFWMECGHVSGITRDHEPEGRFDDAAE
jgi:hypothetical protein